MIFQKIKGNAKKVKNNLKGKKIKQKVKIQLIIYLEMIFIRLILIHLKI